MKIKGRVHRFVPNDDINTDYIISGRYKFKIDDMNQLAKHVMEDISPDFASKVKQGDIVVAGRNFGCGSSREHAPRALLQAGFSCVVAESYARIFYRNCINVGLLPIECRVEADEGDALTIDLKNGTIRNETKNKEWHFAPFPAFVRI